MHDPDLESLPKSSAPFETNPNGETKAETEHNWKDDEERWNCNKPFVQGDLLPDRSVNRTCRILAATEELALRWLQSSIPKCQNWLETNKDGVTLFCFSTWLGSCSLIISFDWLAWIFRFPLLLPNLLFRLPFLRFFLLSLPFLRLFLLSLQKGWKMNSRLLPFCCRVSNSDK